MKGIITVTNPIGNVFSGMIDVKDGLQEGVQIKRVKGGWPLIVRTRFPGFDDCVFAVYVSIKAGSKVINKIFFDFKKIQVDKTFKINGRNFSTGRITSWTCSFQKTED